MTTSAASRATITPLSGRSARIERIFNAPPAKVWRAMTEPALIARWWGRGHPMTIERFELRRGGHWRFVEHSDHGTHGFEGRFAEVDPPHKLEQTFEYDGMPGHVMFDSATLEDLGDGRTKLVTISTAMAVADLQAMMASGMEEGMNASYAALDRVLDAMDAGVPANVPSKDAPATVRTAATVPTVEVKAGTGTAMHVLVGPQQGDTGFALRRFVMQPGGGMPLHTNLVEHQQYVLRGKARITIGAEVHEVAADHTLFIPAGVPHSYDVVEGPFEFICVVPDRPDQVTLVGAC